MFLEIALGAQLAASRLIHAPENPRYFQEEQLIAQFIRARDVTLYL